MNLNEYQLLANKTASEIYNNIVTAPSMGLAREASEAMELVHKAVHHGKLLDKQKLAEELGDTLWNLAQMCTVFGFSLEDVAQQNLEKLRLRHGESYDENHYKQMELATIPEGNPIVAGEE